MAKKTKGSVSRSASGRRKATAQRSKRVKRTVAVAALPMAGDDSRADQDALVPGMVRAEPSISTGPRKTRLSGVPAPRLVSHKARSTWFQARASWPIREAPVARVITERERVVKALPNASGSSQWEPIGPTNIGGRITSLVVDPTFPDRIWAGAAGGGVWHSPDAGLTWQPQWHDQDVLNVGSLAIDPTDSNVLYCGTGEANLSADSYGGVGLYRTIDAGSTWQLHASSERAKIPRALYAIDPRTIIDDGSTLPNPQGLRVSKIGLILFRKGDTLVRTLGEEHVLTPVSETRFRVGNTSLMVEFVVDEAGVTQVMGSGFQQLLARMKPRHPSKTLRAR